MKPGNDAVNIVDRTPSKINDSSCIDNTGHKEIKIKSDNSDETNNRLLCSFSSCFSKHQDMGSSKANKHRPLCICTKSSKYAFKICCHLQQQFQANYDRRIAKIISAINMSYKRTLSTSMSNQSVSSYKMYTHSMYGPKKLLGGLFESSKQLQLFKHDFKITIYINGTVET
eukprot:955582-Ditylum_brightwellii.AAC.1